VRRSNRFLSFVRDNSLTLAFLVLLLAAVIGQAVAGVSELNGQQRAEGGATLSVGQYLLSSDFAVDIAENWQSEYLQFALYIVATSWLVQRGSSESKQPEDIGTGSDEQQLVGSHARPDSPSWARAGGLRAAVYGRSLGAIMTFFFLMSLLAQSIAGRASFNSQLLNRGQDALSWPGYVTSADFWDRTLQNWQSEFLAVASMAAFAIYLRQRGSPESKVVGAPHEATAETP
jgi:hypothetical protein